MVSIHRPLGYGPNTLPLRHSATCSVSTDCVPFVITGVCYCSHTEYFVNYGCACVVHLHLIDL